VLLRAIRWFRFLALLAITTPLHAQIPQEEYAERRAALSAAVGEGVILAVGSAAPPQDYIPFHQNSLFRYLTGFLETNAALVMVVGQGEVQETLFVNPRDPAEETWEGYRLGPGGAMGAHGIPGRNIHELPGFLADVLQGRDRVHVVGRFDPDAPVRDDVTQRIQALLADHPGVEVESVSGEVNRLRGVKSEAEQELLRRANALTVQAHREVAGALAPNRNEFEIQAVLEYTFRRNGAERPAFASIVGSGPNSTILHYNANDRFMEDGDVVVVDIGASYGGYAADVTRTYPVSGTFTEPQREIYQLVRDAQAAAEALAGPGVPVPELFDTASMVLAEGLAELGLIESPEATFEGPGGQAIPQLRLYYMHGLGHGTGLDVHDPWPPVLEPGVAFTIEPGIYVRPNLLEEVIPETPANRRMIAAIQPAFERYVNIGVRIEDGYIVREGGGVEWISPAPREAEEVEAIMAEPWSGPGERNAEWVEWFRRLK
jgi:Xaa-Pro aminopeptidase